MKYFHLRYFSNKSGGFIPHIRNRFRIQPQSGHGSLCAGFTLIEMAVVAGIIGFLSTALIINFSRTRIDVDQSANLIMATIREAQTKAVSSSIYGGYNPCGYGIHYVSPTQVAIYIGQDASTVNCLNIANKNYQAGRDVLLGAQSFGDPKIQFTGAFNDIFFLPPDPKTYLNNNSSLNQPPITIQIGQIGGTCPQNCRTISVYPSGKIESQ